MFWRVVCLQMSSYQRIGELDCVKKLYIFPDMGDGGLAYGAAMLSFSRAHKFVPAKSKLETVYLGPDFLMMK